eukprot:CAMPEP_0178948130 /NCGR_PEP_ID=MMETSP0789-20121207/5299_1 /TAXON_ID=3005 /ORGANISM="Rhizosolenia setigera, Strain CCMP 1694" /LENGTH=409 /DNA_ID=CAMNT_0020628457 /DNA_START=149 /DNA_END=1375 /DNA_ORIENTATION=-
MNKHGPFRTAFRYVKYAIFLLFCAEIVIVSTLMNKHNEIEEVKTPVHPKEKLREDSVRHELVQEKRTEQQEASTSVTTKDIYKQDFTEQHVGNKTVAIIGIVPDNKERLLALWSQLECYFGNEKYDEVIVSAPTWARDDGIIEPFLSAAEENIPHFKSGSVSLKIQYYENDRYDVGLWCDALLDENNGALSEGNNFVLSNDSIMAVEQFTAIIDTLKERNLSMTSLNYSFLEKYWLESVLRAFSKDGIVKYIEYACKGAPSMRDRCSENDFKRCIVENYEIAIVDLFERKEVWGLFPSDVPKDMIRRRGAPQTWPGNFAYWNQILRKEMKFPAVKISWEAFFHCKIRNPRYKERRLKDDDLLKRCTSHLDPSFLNPMGKRIKETGRRLEKNEKKKYLDYYIKEDYDTMW